MQTKAASVLVHAHEQILSAAALWHVAVERVQVSQWPTAYRLALGCTAAERRRDPAGKRRREGRTEADHRAKLGARRDGRRGVTLGHTPLGGQQGQEKDAVRLTRGRRFR
jgi:hypothetical protein